MDSDIVIDELKRLHAAATPGELRSVGYRLSHTLNTRIEYSVEHIEELGQTRYGAPYQAIPFARQEDASWHAALHNAFPALIARLEAAEAAMQWRPIEEAPDGVKLDHVGRHWDSRSGWLRGVAFYKSEAITAGFTHYFIIPAPPEAAR